MEEIIKIATRSSQLAIWQAKFIQDQLLAKGIKSELIEFETKGDKILDRSLAKIGSKGLFTEELETCLLEGKAHIAVHSAKDLPSTLADNLELIAFGEREAFHDVLVSEKEVNLHSNLKIGTSSTRRVALLKKYFPNFDVVQMRGNLQTRINKMQNGDCDALMLAYAGVHRMGYSALIKHHFDSETIVPPVGQGALALECSTLLDNKIKQTIKQICNHEDTEICLLAERSLLNIMEGGCSVPIFALAHLEGNEIVLKGGIIGLDGKTEIRHTLKGKKTESIALGKHLAMHILSNGGEKLLKDIKEQL